MQPHLDGTDPLGPASVVDACSSVVNHSLCGHIWNVHPESKIHPSIWHTKAALVKALKFEITLCDCAPVAFCGFLPFDFIFLFCGRAVSGVT